MCICVAVLCKLPFDRIVHKLLPIFFMHRCLLSVCQFVLCSLKYRRLLDMVEYLAAYAIACVDLFVMLQVEQWEASVQLMRSEHAAEVSIAVPCGQSLVPYVLILLHIYLAIEHLYYVHSAFYCVCLRVECSNT